MKMTLKQFNFTSILFIGILACAGKGHAETNWPNDQVFKYIVEAAQKNQISIFKDAIACLRNSAFFLGGVTLPNKKIQIVLFQAGGNLVRVKNGDALAKAINRPSDFKGSEKTYSTDFRYNDYVYSLRQTSDPVIEVNRSTWTAYLISPNRQRDSVLTCTTLFNVHEYLFNESQQPLNP